MGTTRLLPLKADEREGHSQCLRVARNILTSVRAGDRTIGVPIPHELSVEALYSVSHALFLFTSPHALLDRDRREEDDPAAAAAGADTLQYAEWLESLVQSEYPLDVSYLSESVAPLLPPDRQARLRSLCAAIRDEDATPREPKVVSAEIKWPIGHVFRHRLFGYLAITRGFDYRCEAGEQCMLASLSLSLSVSLGWLLSLEMR